MGRVRLAFAEQAAKYEKHQLKLCQSKGFEVGLSLSLAFIYADYRGSESL